MMDNDAEFTQTETVSLSADSGFAEASIPPENVSTNMDLEVSTSFINTTYYNGCVCIYSKSNF